MTDHESFSAHDLCKACGLCCRGGRFTFGALSPGEAPIARSKGLRVIAIDGEESLGLPCPQHKDGCCSIYHDWRPAVCLNYSCKVIKQHAAGDLDSTEAMAHIRAVRALFDPVDAELGPLTQSVLDPEFLKKQGLDHYGADASERAPSPATLMNLVALKLYYQKHFKA